MVEEKERKSISNVGMLDSGKSYKRQLPEVVDVFICYPNCKKLSKKYVQPASKSQLPSMFKFSASFAAWKWSVETLSLLLIFTPYFSLAKKER